jgi:guanyl-specific ribonuclease Sa
MDRATQRAKAHDADSSARREPHDQESEEPSVEATALLRRAVDGGHQLSASGVLQLQNLLGNRRTHALLSRRVDSGAGAPPSRRSSIGSIMRKIIQRTKPGLSQAQTLTSSGFVSKRPRNGLTSGERAGGFVFGNREGNLPGTDSKGNKISYTEYDVNAYNGRGRDAERVVVGSDGRYWYTGDHYSSFTQIT